MELKYWVIIIVGAWVLFWGVTRIIDAIRDFVITLKNIPASYKLEEDYRKCVRENWEIKSKLYNIEQQYSELEKRWKQVRIRKEELRHENRRLKKEITTKTPTP